MNKLERQMLDYLKQLKQHNISGIKISFEDEGLTGELAQIITSVSMRADVPVAIKIGGCEARRDLHDAKVLGADKIVAPMIETPYSLKKFVEAKNAVYHADEEWDTTEYHPCGLAGGCPFRCAHRCRSVASDTGVTGYVCQPYAS